MAGTALGSTPILDRPTIGSNYQAHEQSARADDAKALPDHYPLVTRAGTVPVAQLSERGLFSQARYRAFYAAADYASTDYGPGEFVDASYDPGERSPRMNIDRDPALGIGDPEPAAARPLALDDGPVMVAAAGNEAKLVNVALALAD